MQTHTAQKKATIHQVTTMLATSKKLLFPSHTSMDDSSLAGAAAQVIIKVSGHQYRWLAGGYDGNKTFGDVASMVVTWWIVFFMRSDIILYLWNA